MFTTPLECGHRIRWTSRDGAPEKDSYVWCVRCQDMCKVTGLIGPWRCRCITCRTLYFHGTDRVSIEAAGTAHVVEHRHTVAVWQVGTDQHWVLRYDDHTSSVHSTGMSPADNEQETRKHG